MNVFVHYLFNCHNDALKVNRIKSFLEERRDEIFKIITSKENKQIIMDKVKEMFWATRKNYFNEDAVKYLRILYEKWKDDLPDQLKYDYCPYHHPSIRYGEDYKKPVIGLHTYLFNDVTLNIRNP